MCIPMLTRFGCNHKKRWWNFCDKATPEQRELQQPCRTELLGQEPQTENGNRNCCSTKCCHEDLNEKIEYREYVKRLYEWQNLPNDRGVKTAKHDLKQATARHFNKCLEAYQWSDSSIISNKDRLRLKKPLYDPKPLQIPSYPEITEIDRSRYLAQLSKWTLYPKLVNDQQLFKHYKYAQDEKRLDIISKWFDYVLWNGGFKWQIDDRFADLAELQKHVDNVMPLGPNPYLHDLEYVMQMNRFSSFRIQMGNLRLATKREYSSGKFPPTNYDNWTHLIDSIRLKLDELIDHLNCWLECQSSALQMSVEYFRRNLRAYEEAKEQYLASFNHHSKKLEELCPSLSTSVPSEFNMPVSGELEQIQLQGERGRSEERPREQYGRRDTSTSARASARKRAKGKGPSCA